MISDDFVGAAARAGYLLRFAREGQLTIRGRTAGLSVHRDSCGHLPPEVMRSANLGIP